MSEDDMSNTPEIGEQLKRRLVKSGSEVQTGEEIIKQLKEGLSKLKEGYISDLTIAVGWTIDELKGKVVVPASRWDEIKKLVERIQDNPTCDLSYKPLGYQVSIKDMEKLTELVKDV